jgi:hypothetical protein
MRGSHGVSGRPDSRLTGSTARLILLPGDVSVRQVTADA